jgi:hypothetical protein
MFSRNEFEEVSHDQLEPALKAGLRRGRRIADVTKTAAGKLKIAWYVDHGENTVGTIPSGERVANCNEKENSAPTANVQRSYRGGAQCE